jgi:hypothetical protein
MSPDERGIIGLLIVLVRMCHRKISLFSGSNPGNSLFVKCQLFTITALFRWGFHQFRTEFGDLRVHRVRMYGGRSLLFRW